MLVGFWFKHLKYQVLKKQMLWQNARAMLILNYTFSITIDDIFDNIKILDLAN